MLEVLLLYVFGNHDQGVHTERMENGFGVSLTENSMSVSLSERMARKW
jgi:hypothetical protein